MALIPPLSSSSSSPSSLPFTSCSLISSTSRFKPSSRVSSKPITPFPSLIHKSNRHGHKNHRHRLGFFTSSQLCTKKTLDTPALDVFETVSDEELWAAALLRVRSFYEFDQGFRVEDHKRYLTEHEFEALKDRISGKRIGFKRVACINATLPLSQMLSYSDDLCASCKFSHNGEDRIVVGTLDLNQSVRLADEISGKRPEGIGADFARAYLSNVCVAKELHRNGVGHALVAKSKKIAQEWGITDLYAHVAIDNEAARNLYYKSGFVYENDEPAWQARFLDRPRRILLWADLTYGLRRKGISSTHRRLTDGLRRREKANPMVKRS